MAKYLGPMMVTAAMLVAAPAAAQNPPIANPAGAGLLVIVNTTDPITATYLGTSASFSNDLFLVRPGGDQFLFNNQANMAGDTFDLGSFALGIELVFRLVTPELDGDGNPYSYRTGPGVRNPDGSAHAAVQANYLTAGTTLVSFEDLYTGPFDYNDLSFSFTGTIAGGIPEPASWALMMLGFGAVGGGMRVRRKVTFATA